jgi:hypothetical protein
VGVRDQPDAVLATTRRLKFGNDGRRVNAQRRKRIRCEMMRTKGRREVVLRFRRSRESWSRRALTYGKDCEVVAKVGARANQDRGNRGSLGEIMDGGGGKTRIHYQ